MFKSTTYPCTAWVLQPSFRPKEVTFASHYASWSGDDYGDAKAAQHEYVRRKLLDTGDRTLVEDSWRDDFWGWGPNRDGQNMLGRLWMEVRAELLAAQEKQHG